MIQTVIYVEIEQLDEPVTVYNFEVADWHTYYVSEDEVLVHNSCGMPPIKGGKISANINMDKIYSHVFSQDHVKNGIMELGTSEADILNKFFNIAEATSKQWVEGSNEIRTVINGIDVAVRNYVKNGQMINIDGFVGHSQRVIDNLISY